ncbi:MAG: hypothetical protein H7A31_00055 [Thermotogae bacterium]|nr:hypothetical protein [Thermotogota bacterium]MCP5465069.1 hypothetical protein [Thermotogota bacterium]HOO74361.1 hypothetical protein [Tepiditoga sp.]
MKQQFLTFSSPKLSSQYEFIKILKESKNYEEIKDIAKKIRGNTKDNVNKK